MTDPELVTIATEAAATPVVESKSVGPNREKILQLLEGKRFQ